VRVDSFDFDLPQERIALRPALPRDSSRLLVVQSDGGLQSQSVSDLPDFFQSGDILVFNNTKVIPARLAGNRVGRAGTNPAIEVTLHQRESDDTWKAFAKPARKLVVGDRLRFGGGNDACFAGTMEASVVEKLDGGEIALKFDLSGAFLDEAINSAGIMPLPPYIASKRGVDARDLEDYQTIYSAHNGAVAAPTAGLHFTEELMSALAARGVECVFVTLHVGAGTFLPVKADDTTDHKMHGEWGEIANDVVDRLNAARAAGGRIVAVGTTSLRLLESAAEIDGTIKPYSGSTEIFITPGHAFRAIDLLLTNFHLPRSTLFMLVSAFSGLETMRRAYAYAIENSFRFYSYGDACLLYPQTKREKVR
jgi:S-adenosylmethionine:tRNA ribosyltransferase-isomerase